MYNIIIYTLILSGISAQSFAIVPLSDLMTHEVYVQPIHFINSGWTDEIIQENLSDAQAIYAQCGLKIQVSSSIQHQNESSEVYFDLEGYSEVGEKQNENGTLKYGAMYPAPDKVRVFLFERFDMEYANILSTAVPTMRAVRPEQKPVLNSIWLSHRVDEYRTLTVEEGGYNKSYNVLAHELGHILLNDDHTEDSWVHNLMNEQFLNLNGRLTNEQCEQIKKSSLVHPITAPNKSLACPNINSKLSRNIFFENHDVSDTDQYCGRAGEIIAELEKVQDTVSDLQPVFGVDFYFIKNPSEIQFMDRHVFEGSLDITYDPQGLIPLDTKQQKVLWSHELGHAILNEQLKVDWPWYAERIKILEIWGDAVAEATEIESQLETMKDLDKQVRARLRTQELSEIIQVQIEKVNQLKNGKEFEAILAPYHEMFADAVAIIYSGDPQVIKRALANPRDPDMTQYTEEERAALNDRDYSFLRDVATWDRHQAHSMLAPSLAIWWQKISNTGSLAKLTKKEHIRNLYRSILNEINARTSDPQLWELSPRQINERLIQRL